LLTGAKEDRSLVLRDVALLLRPAQKRLEAALLAHVCSGTAHAALRLADKTNAVNAYCLIEGVRADQAADLAGYLKGITGRMDAKLFFSSQPKGVLRGKLDMREGVLKEYQFFQWLSDLFKLDGLKRIAFEALSTDFWVDEEGAGLRDLQLRSAKADVGGFYGVRNGMASGKLTLGLSRQMMGESPKLSRLLKLVGEKTSKLDFNFQLSGAAEAPNFLWLESDFKQELEKAIPGFVERKIEKTIEDIVNSE
jgi:hypothetical protein